MIQRAGRDGEAGRHSGPGRAQPPTLAAHARLGHSASAAEPNGELASIPLPDTDGLHLAVLCRRVKLTIDEWCRTLLSLQVFLVNDRDPGAIKELVDQAYIFQAAIELRSAAGFVPRPDLRSADCPGLGPAG